VFAGDVEGLGVAQPQECFSVRASWQASVNPAVQGPGGEVVKVGTDVTDTARGDHCGEQLEGLDGSGGCGERENVLVVPDWQIALIAVAAAVVAAAVAVFLDRARAARRHQPVPGA
jgi:hypothetical protein